MQDNPQRLPSQQPARALDLAERHAPDVVIVGQPELCRRLRAGEPGRTWDRNVPVNNNR